MSQLTTTAPGCSFTCIGLALCFAGLHMSATAKLQYLGHRKLATMIRIGKIVVSVAFALFYGATHGLL